MCPYPEPENIQDDGCKRRREISRREFLRAAGVAAAGLAVAGCQPKLPSSAVSKPGGVVSAQVAIVQAATYDKETIHQAVFNLIDKLGGLKSIVKSGDTVAIKVNLTGGISVNPLPGVSAIESYVTHPEVVSALGRLVFDAGAKEVYIIEAVYEWESYKTWGYEQVAVNLGAKLIDLNKPDPYKDFIHVPVGDNHFIYPEFIFNQIIKDVNVFMSVSKMKNHYNCGVTHTMKNLIGLVPAEFYKLTKADSSRTGFHGAADQTKMRLPRVVIDLNRARTINFSLIDGVSTSEAGEGPWIATMTPIKPGVLIAGKNPVATDAVATAVMGFDPTSNYPDAPFLRADNHLNLAQASGLGTNRLEEIEVLGVPIDKVKTKFTPCL